MPKKIPIQYFNPTVSQEAVVGQCELGAIVTLICEQQMALVASEFLTVIEVYGEGKLLFDGVNKAT